MEITRISRKTRSRNVFNKFLKARSGYFIVRPSIIYFKVKSDSYGAVVRHFYLVQIYSVSVEKIKR